MLRVGQISFVNVAPFFSFWNDPALEFIKGPPSFLGNLAKQEKLDLAPLPVFCAFQLEKTFEFLGNFSIAADGKVLSVFLFSKKPIEALSHETVELTTESMTSIALLKLLFQERYHLEGVKFGTENAQATLLIGDTALEESCRQQKWRFCYDLAELWQDWTSLPFTFARWVIRRNVPESEKQRMREAIDTSLHLAEERLEEVSAAEASRIGLPKDIILKYLRNFIFRSGEREEAGLRLFQKKLQEQGML